MAEGMEAFDFSIDGFDKPVEKTGKSDRQKELDRLFKQTKESARKPMQDAFNRWFRGRN